VWFTVKRVKRAGITNWHSLVSGCPPVAKIVLIEECHQPSFGNRVGIDIKLRRMNSVSNDRPFSSDNVAALSLSLC